MSRTTSRHAHQKACRRRDQAVALRLRARGHPRQRVDRQRLILVFGGERRTAGVRVSSAGVRFHGHAVLQLPREVEP